MTNVVNLLRENNCHALVLGAGRSGIAATKLLAARGHKVTLYDDHPPEKLRYVKEACLAPSDAIRFVFNEVPKLPYNTDVVVVSPGVPPHHGLLRKARHDNIPIMSEIDLGMIYLGRQKLLGVTGTNGKSTTTVMLEGMLNHADIGALACGNLGRPFCDVVLANDDNYNYLVVELSSFQLESSEYLRLDGAIIVNITPDHLDRHANYQEYQDAKLKIARFLTTQAPLVMHEHLRDLAPKRVNTSFFTGHDFAHMPFYTPSVRGFHNYENAMASATLMRALGINDDAILSALQAFKALPHRCEVVAQKNRVLFVNDSKGTTVEAVKKALQTFEQPTHLLLGGITKGEDFAVLRTDHFPHVRRYYVYGRDHQKIVTELNSTLATSYRDLASAMNAAISNARPGETILLSPGCASYDQFVDYQHRGETFRKLATTACAHNSEMD